MSTPTAALACLAALVDREAALIVAEHRDAVGTRRLTPSKAQALADAALKNLWAWDDFFKQRIRNSHGSGAGAQEVVDLEPQGTPFKRALYVTLGDLTAGQGLVDDLGEAIIDLAIITILRQLLGVPALDLEASQRVRVRVAANKIPRSIVPELPDEQGDPKTEKKRPRLGPGRK